MPSPCASVGDNSSAPTLAHGVGNTRAWSIFSIANFCETHFVTVKMLALIIYNDYKEIEQNICNLLDYLYKYFRFNFTHMVENFIRSFAATSGKG